MKKYYRLQINETYREIITIIFWIPTTNLRIQACVFVAKTTGVAEPLNSGTVVLNLYPRSFKLILVHGPPTVQLDLKGGEPEKTVQPIKNI